MRYCSKCVMPDTKPYVSFDESGVCNACKAHELKNERESGIDWAARKLEFEEIVREAESRKSPFFDVLVPVSGGKDSITQVHRLLGHGLRILAVNVDYGIKTEVGQHNLQLIADMGANLAIYRPEQTLHRQLIRIGLEDFGDPDLLSHTLLHAYPLHLALRFDIPLVLLGENSAFEYGGDCGLAQKNHITREWFDRYAANAGRGARYISENYAIPMDRLRLYDYPDELDGSRTRAVFASYFFHWDSEVHLGIAKEYGFKALDRAREGTYRNYVGIDEKINRVHQYLKVLKFVYGRATDHACEDIRNGRITRDEAKCLVAQHDLDDLSDYYLVDFMNYLGYSRSQLTEILERFRNPKIWDRDSHGKWFIPGHLVD